MRRVLGIRLSSSESGKSSSVGCLGRGLIVGSCILLAFGCAGHAARTQTARDALNHGEASVALQAINSELNVSSEKQLPEDPSGDNSILLLDRAVILQQLENYELSSRDLEVADKQVEMMDFSRSSADEISRYVFSDDSGPYKAPPYEKLMVNTMNMLNYVLRGDLSGGRVEARRFAVMQKYLKDNEDSGAELLGAGSYLAGFIFEKSNDADAALRYYDEALQFGEFASLAPAIQALAPRSSYRTPRLLNIIGAGEETSADGPQDDQQDAPAEGTVSGEPSTGGVTSKATPPQAALLGNTIEVSKEVSIGGEVSVAVATETGVSAEANIGAEEVAPPADVAAPTGEAELLVVFSFGRVPAKEARRVAIGIALDEAGQSMDPSKRQQANELSKKGLLTWINYPSLPAPKGPYSTPKANVAGDGVALDLVPIDELTVNAWKKTRGAVVTSAITRMITRAVAGEVVEKTSDSAWSKLASLTLQVGMAAADTPDTRSWSTLPARIALGRLKVPSGKHTVELSVSGKTVKHEIDMKPGEWEAVGLTVLKQN